MKLKEVLKLLQDIHKNNSNISEPSICGGAGRDKYLGTLKEITDLDITTGDSTVQYLSSEFTNILSKKYQITSKKMDDGHVSVFLGNLKVDFSSNFITPNIDSVLKKINVVNPTDMEKELYSRDFTCNTLLMSLDLETITDPTKLGIKDIDNKIIKTCLSPNITLKNNLNRIVRVIYLSSKLEFSVDEEIIEWIKQNKESVLGISKQYIKKNIEKAISFNPQNTSDLLNKMGIWELIPMSEKIYPLYSQHTVKQAQFFTNYDYVDLPSGPGTSVYHDISRPKSIDAWRKKRRKRRKKILKNIKKLKLL